MADERLICRAATRHLNCFQMTASGRMRPLHTC